MILVDTSVWIDHLRGRQPRMAAALNGEQVLAHPFVIGELACVQLRNRKEILALLAELPQPPVATDDEVLDFIEKRNLIGTGLGYIDVHLLASATLFRSARLWTQDKRLAEAATKLKLAYEGTA